MPLVAGEAAVCSIEHRESQQDYEKLAHTWIIRGFSLEGVERQARSCGRPQAVSNERERLRCRNFSSVRGKKRIFGILDSEGLHVPTDMYTIEY